MRTFILLFFLPYLLFADFTLVYRLDNNITQEVNYKDAQHVLFTFKEGKQIFEKLLISGNEKYLTLYENNIENLYQIDDNISEPIPKEEYDPTTRYKLLKKMRSFKFQSFPAEIWLILDNEEKVLVTVSKDPTLVDAVRKSIAALKKILPADKQADADIFDMGKNYILLAKDNLQLLSFSQEKLNIALFSTTSSLSKEEQEKFAQETQRCFHSLCCGRKHFKSNSITAMLNREVNGWQLAQSGKCENIDSKSGLESAIFKKENQVIVAEMTTGDNTLYGKIESLQEQGVEVNNIHKTKVHGFKTLSAYLPFIDTTVIDIRLPNTTLSIYQKGKQNLLPFVDKSIKFNALSNF